MQPFLDAIRNLMEMIAAGLGIEYVFVVEATIAIVLVSFICGSIGALVVGNRMAFFSDALAHCSFAGVALGIIVAVLSGGNKSDDKLGYDTLDLLLPIVMIVSGVFFGIGIAYVRERTNMASDTVIGVFFAAAIGFGAILFPTMKLISNKNAEQFLFGSANFVSELNLVMLTLLAAITLATLMLRYNQLVFGSFNASLARSRRIPLRLHNYLFIILLAVIVNVCIQAVGILLINAMLIVPAATAVNLSRNLRQMFWWTIAVSLTAGLGGMALSLRPSFTVIGIPIKAGTGGWIVMLCVVAFAASMIIGPRLNRRRAPPASLAG
jgi:zinc transport system permease protein